MKQNGAPLTIFVASAMALGLCGRASATPCPLSGTAPNQVCTITITISGCQNNICTVTANPAIANVASGISVKWQLSSPNGGVATVFFLPDPNNVIYANSVNPIFSGSASFGGTTVTNSGSTALTATYFISWTDNTNRAFVDPKVVVSGANGLDVQRKKKKAK